MHKCKSSDNKIKCKKYNLFFIYYVALHIIQIISKSCFDMSKEFIVKILKWLNKNKDVDMWKTQHIFCLQYTSVKKWNIYKTCNHKDPN